MRRPLLLLLTLLLTGCPPVSPNLTGSGMDMFSPVRIRIHPLTRIAPAPPPSTAPATSTAPAATNPASLTPGIILEAHIELIDQFGHEGKGAGTLSLELYSPGLLGRKSNLITSWKFPIDTPETNRAHWDHISRTYFFKLPLVTPIPRNTGSLTLSTTLTLPSGATLTSDQLISIK